MNTKFIIGVASFIIGGAVGSVVTWQVTKNHYKNYYENKANEEIADVKEFYKNKDENMTEVVVNEPEELEIVEVEDKVSVREQQPDLKNMVTDLGYMNYANVDTNRVNVEPPKVAQNRPYVIAPDEYGDCSYELESLTYYADEVLATDFDEVIYDIEGTVGEESLMHFGDYEDDLVHVRNPELQIDYEIFRDTRTFALVVDKNGGV